MRDRKIYLHSNIARLQSLVHVLAVAWVLLKASHLPFNTPFYMYWYSLNTSFGVLLSVAAVLQAANKFAYLYLAVMLNILAGVVIIVESLLRLTVAENLLKSPPPMLVFCLVNFAGGLFFILTGIYEGRIRRIPYIAFNRQQVYGRRSLFSTFTHSWSEMAEVNFRHNRVKITTQQGDIYRYQVAKLSAGGNRFKSAENFCLQLIPANKSNAEMTGTY
jgi:hypothetical protein